MGADPGSYRAVLEILNEDGTSPGAVVAQFSASTWSKQWTSDKRTISVPASGDIAYDGLEPTACGKELKLDVWDYDPTNPPDYDGDELRGSASAPCSDHNPFFKVVMRRA